MKINHSTTSSSAFSLVELSIVLVILGLLTGGILAGQSLIRAAELRAVSTEYQRYATAISSFRDKYFAIPGDFNNASGFGWGSYNGDADGNIEASTTDTSNETSTFWIHLASAGLIEGSYTNIAATSTSVATMTAGTNNPRSKLGSSTGWNVYALGTVAAASADYFDSSYGNAFFLGGGGAGAAFLPTEALKAEEAWNLDTKMDDGKPALGSVLTLERDALAAATAAGCSNPITAATTLVASTYTLNNTGINCALVFKTGY